MNNDDLKPALENSEMVPRENEWQDVGIAHRASPWRETQNSVSGNNIRTISPSRYQALNDIEEGELESSSSDEDDEAESSDPPQKEIKTIPQNANKAKTSSRNKAGTNPQVQNDKKKSAKPTKKKCLQPEALNDDISLCVEYTGLQQKSQTFIISFLDSVCYTIIWLLN